MQRKSAASTATTQLSFHHRFAKQQNATKNVWDNFYVLRKSKIPSVLYIVFHVLEGIQLSEDKNNS